MSAISRRRLAALLGTAALARPVASRAQSGAVRIGLLSDVGGPYRNSGGPGNRVAAELACEDAGGSVLGRPLQVLQADIQNKADLAAAMARQWIDQGVDVLGDGSASSSGLAIQEVAKQSKHVYLAATPLTTALVGKQCSPYGFQFVGNTFAAAKGISTPLVRDGGSTWFFITADYDFGTSMQRDMTDFVTQAGGQVVGSVRAPLGSADFSSFLLQAQSSGAKVVGLISGGADLQNCIKQANEFGIGRSGTRLATPFMSLLDVVAVGQDICEGLALTNSFYWAMSPPSKAWSARFMTRMGNPPNEYNAGMYAAVTHWLRAVKATGTLDGETVAAVMHATPVQDFYNDRVRILPNGSVPQTMYLWQVKKRTEGQDRWDVFKEVSSLPSPEAFAPSDAFGCTLKGA